MTWFKKLVWKFRRKRLILVHIKDNDSTLEGILLGIWANHYCLRTTKLNSEEGNKFPLDGEVLVPTGNVLFIQVL